MPVCFQLRPIGYHEPVSFQSIDNAICQNLDLDWDEANYTCGWYDRIGFLLALGKTFAEITDIIQKQIDHTILDFGKASDRLYNLLRINHFLLENYTSDSWTEIGKR